MPNTKRKKRSVEPRNHVLEKKKKQEKGFSNVRVVTGDINTFDLGDEDKGTFDRVMSIEMFEHMKNYQLLIAKISNWLKSGGKLFGQCRQSKRLCWRLA